MTYSPMKTCANFWSWLYHTWRIRKRWEGPYVLVYEVGTRFCGVEYVREQRLVAD